MMKNFYVNDHAQNSGEHEVHQDGCSHLPKLENRTYLGVFDNCADALTEASHIYSSVDGCYYCCNPCHNS